ncbi:hypothetical protein Y1Q_0005204 [Alligator mississippiensis]|uniref:Gypsy retrotransposon integrase-like protein 1 n=1 Tax=Alligator mississippiensis TaxID=8496 RepID=A0A151MT04_ALLMI|nr:hypothetical protein Y1Q_0005204 [Alligator mississippiensis]
MPVVLAWDLPYSMILGRDWHEIYKVLKVTRNISIGEVSLARDNTEDLDLKKLTSSQAFQKAQEEEQEFQAIWEMELAKVEGKVVDPAHYACMLRFEVRNGLLYQVKHGPSGEAEIAQLLIPTQFRLPLLNLAHRNPLGGHMGQHKTEARLTRWYFWARLYNQVEKFCRACPACQMVSGNQPTQAPLQPMPIIEVPFLRIMMAIVGPLSKSSAGHQYLLLIVDYATRFPEAVLNQSVTGPWVMEELMKWVARVGIPKEIITNQGLNSMSNIIHGLCKVLQIKHLHTMVYHPQTNEVV